jgi:hypothetical protein
MFDHNVDVCLHLMRVFELRGVVKMCDKQAQQFSQNVAAHSTRHK